MSERPRIRLLPDPLINQIAAGEVVERPASAIKELLENALDAGSTRIHIDIEHGGKRLIRMVDNGHGIEPDDLALAVTRHATSKIRELDDLTHGTTLGFRGEALPSIAAVSHLTLRSTVHGAAEGRELVVEGGNPPVIKAAAPVPGTTIEVADLFFNTPVRAKFLKADATEWGHIVETVNELAMGRPGVHFSLAHNARPPKVYPPVADLAARVRQIYPREMTEQLIPVAVTDPESGQRLNGLISRPGFTRSGRDQQKLLVNGRCVRNPTLNHAVYAAFETALPGGRHPLFFLALDVPPEQVDVNVHPTKREIRLCRGNTLHHFVREAVREALGGFRGNTLRLTRMAPAEAPGATANPAADWVDRLRQATVHSLDTARDPQLSYAAVKPASAAAPQQLPMQPVEAGQPAPMRVVGQLHRTFVLVEQATQLRIIDQHTAHERVLYERLMARFLAEGLASQRLLIPTDIVLSPQHGELIDSHREALGKLGIDVERFGGDAFLVRALPELLLQRDAQELLDDIADDLASNPGAPLQERLKPILATLACHAAVKAGDHLSERQMTDLIADLERVDNPHTCPHGRAVTAVLDRSGMKKLFDRNWGPE